MSRFTTQALKDHDFTYQLSNKVLLKSGSVKEYEKKCQYCYTTCKLPVPSPFVHLLSSAANRIMFHDFVYFLYFSLQILLLITILSVIYTYSHREAISSGSDSCLAVSGVTKDV